MWRTYDCLGGHVCIIISTIIIVRAHEAFLQFNTVDIEMGSNDGSRANFCLIGHRHAVVPAGPAGEDSAVDIEQAASAARLVGDSVVWDGGGRCIEVGLIGAHHLITHGGSDCRRQVFFEFELLTYLSYISACVICFYCMN